MRRTAGTKTSRRVTCAPQPTQRSEHMRSVTRVAPSRPCVRASASRLRVCLRSQSGPAKPLLRRHYSTEVPQQGEPAPQQAEAAPPVPEGSNQHLSRAHSSGPSLRLPLTKLRGTRVRRRYLLFLSRRCRRISCRRSRGCSMVRYTSIFVALAHLAISRRCHRRCYWQKYAVAYHRAAPA